MQQYHFALPNLAPAIAYFQQQLGLPVIQQQDCCADFALSDDASIRLSAAISAAAPACLPMTERLLAALQRNAQNFSRPFVAGIRHCCELPVKLRVPQQQNVPLCQQLKLEQPAQRANSSAFWAQLRSIYADLARFDGYRL